MESAMEPQTNLPDLIVDLEANIDELSSSLSPLLATPLSTQASSLPLLDKSKLYLLTAYAIESLLFSSLTASGADAKSHAVFAELARLKTRFAKVRDAETRDMPPTMRLNVPAAGRMIRAGLAGNDRYDREKEERIAREKAKAKIRAQKLVNRKFDDREETKVQEKLSKKRKAEQELSSESSSDLSSDSDSSEDEQKGIEVENEAAKEAKTEVYDGDEMQLDSPVEGASEDNHVSSENEAFYGKGKYDPAQDSDPTDLNTFLEPAARKAKRFETQNHANHQPLGAAPASSTTVPSPKNSQSILKKRSRRAKRLAPRNKNKKPEELVLPDKAPRTHSETFQALLAGPIKSKSKANLQSEDNTHKAPASSRKRRARKH